MYAVPALLHVFTTTGTASAPPLGSNCRPLLAPRSTARYGTARLAAVVAVASTAGRHAVAALRLTRLSWLSRSVSVPAPSMATAAGVSDE